MKIGSGGKYFAKFWEIIEKFQTVVTNRVLGLTSRERRLLEKMQREHSSRQQTSCLSGAETIEKANTGRWLLQN